jgi:DegV family protein with EDD domain
MSRVGIVTDSTNCIPPELLKQYDIRVVPVGMVINNKVYRDLVDITLAEFKEMSKTFTEQPKTSAVSPGDFVNLFKELSQSTSDILCILVSKALTATHESAYQAKRIVRQENPNLNIEIIDSRTSVGALGFIVIEAARAASEGKSLEEVMTVAEEMVQRVIYLASLETLTYLINIGRAPKITSIGERLNVKPIIGFVDDTGQVEVVARVRNRQKSLSTLVDLVDKYVDTSQPLHMMVHYCNGIEQGEELRDMLTSRYNCVEMHLSEYSPIVLCAVGSLVGLSVYSD